MKKTRKAFPLIIAIILAIFAASGLFAACSGGETDGTKSSEGGVGYVSGTPLGITFVQDKISLGVGDRARIESVVATDGNLYTDGVTWLSSDEGVATVSSGVVTAVSSGKATITASVDGTDFSASCLVIVTNGKTLRVGVKDDVKNFGYYDYVTRTYSGMEIDLAYMIADELCYENVEFVTVDPAEREDDLDYGYVDMVIATYSITEEREERVNFSTPYYTDTVQVLLGTEYSRTDLEYLADFPSYLESARKTLSVGTVEGSTAFSALDAFCDEEDIAWTSMLYGDYFVDDPYPDYEACWEALVSGETDVFVADHSILQSYAEGATDFRYLSDKFSEQRYGVATAIGSVLSEKVDEVVDMFLDGGVIADLLESYGLA